MIVMFVRYVEIDKMFGFILRFGAIFSSGSCELFLETLLNSMYDSRATALLAIEHTEVGSCVKCGTDEVKEDAKKRTAPLSFIHIYVYMYVCILYLNKCINMYIFMLE